MIETPAMAPMTIPAIAPPDKLEPDPDDEPASVVDEVSGAKLGEEDGVEDVDDVDEVDELVSEEVEDDDEGAAVTVKVDIEAVAASLSV